MIRASVSALDSGQLQQSVVFSQAPSPDTSMVMHMSTIDQGLNESINLGPESIDGVSWSDVGKIICAVFTDVVVLFHEGEI